MKIKYMHLTIIIYWFHNNLQVTNEEKRKKIQLTWQGTTCYMEVISDVPDSVPIKTEARSYLSPKDAYSKSIGRKVSLKNLIDQHDHSIPGDMRKLIWAEYVKQFIRKEKKV